MDVLNLLFGSKQGVSWAADGEYRHRHTHTHAYTPSSGEIKVKNAICCFVTDSKQGKGTRRVMNPTSDTIIRCFKLLLWKLVASE